MSKTIEKIKLDVSKNNTKERYINVNWINKALTFLCILVACGLLGGYNGYQKEFIAIFYFIFLLFNFKKFFLINDLKSTFFIFLLLIYPQIINSINSFYNPNLSIFPENKVELIFWLKIIFTPVLSILLYRVGSKTKFYHIKKVVFLTLLINLFLVIVGSILEKNIALTFLDGAYESSGRLYLVGLYIFSYLSIYYYSKKNYILSFIFLIPAFIAQSKIILAAYFIIVLMISLRAKYQKNIIIIISGLVIMFNFGLFNRFYELYTLGDMYRFNEILELHLFWSDNPFSIFFGAGTNHGFRNNVFSIDDEFSYSFLLNYERTIHFGYYDLFYRYGILLSIIYIISILKLLNDKISISVLYFLLLLLASPTLIHGPEALGFFFMLGLFRANKIE